MIFTSHIDKYVKIVLRNCNCNCNLFTHGRLRSSWELVGTCPCMRSRSNWNLEVLVFKERENRSIRRKTLSEQGIEPTTNSTHIWCGRQDSNQGHIGRRRALSPLRHPCSHPELFVKLQFIEYRFSKKPSRFLSPHPELWKGTSEMLLD